MVQFIQDYMGGDDGLMVDEDGNVFDPYGDDYLDSLPKTMTVFQVTDGDPDYNTSEKCGALLLGTAAGAEVLVWERKVAPTTILSPGQGDADIPATVAHFSAAAVRAGKARSAAYAAGDVKGYINGTWEVWLRDETNSQSQRVAEFSAFQSRVGLSGLADLTGSANNTIVDEKAEESLSSDVQRMPAMEESEYEVPFGWYLQLRFKPSSMIPNTGAIGVNFAIPVTQYTEG